MIERNIKKLLLDKIKENGDDPQEVACHYFKQWPLNPEPLQMKKPCSAVDLPEGELTFLRGYGKKYFYKLVMGNKEIKIEKHPNPDPS